MKRTQGNGINLYEGYQALAKKEKSGKANKSLPLILPLALLALVLFAVAGRQLIANGEKTRQLSSLDGEISSLSSAYAVSTDLEARANETEATYNNLAAARFTFTLYPAPSKDLFTKVIDCAAGIFNISQYDFDEVSGTLTVNASAASVNEVPQFVQRLRDTGLFSRVQYIGYTSNDTEEYYCTVACTMQNANGALLEALLSASDGDTQTADANAETADANAETTDANAETTDADTNASAMDMLG